MHGPERMPWGGLAGRGRPPRVARRTIACRPPASPTLVGWRSWASRSGGNGRRRTRRASTPPPRLTAPAVATGTASTRSRTSSSPTTPFSRPSCGAGTPARGCASPERPASPRAGWRCYAVDGRRRRARRRRRSSTSAATPSASSASCWSATLTGRRGSAASGCTSGPWSTASTVRRPPPGLAAAAGRRGHRRGRRGAPDRLLALRRLPLLHRPTAAPLNALKPTRESQTALEQPGCLHAGMDLYKWAHKLVPAVSSDLVLDCFELARDIRTLDMRASPYDLARARLRAGLHRDPGGQGRVRRRAARLLRPRAGAACASRRRRRRGRRGAVPDRRT